MFKDVSYVFIKNTSCFSSEVFFNFLIKYLFYKMMFVYKKMEILKR